MLEALFSAGMNFVWDKGILAAYHWAFKKQPLTIEELKKKTHILFVDDEPFDHLLSVIRDAGWNVSQVKDIHNMDSNEVREADIVFMDYKNVGTRLTPTEEGIGLMRHLRRKYPTKHVIFISGYAGFIPGHEVYGLADDWMAKNADPFEYIDRIEAAARGIYG